VLAYFALFAGIGGTFFLTFIEPLAGGRNGRLALFATLSVGWLAIIASTALQGLDVLDGDFSALLTAGPWEAAMATSFGMLTMAATAALLVAASALIARRPAVARAGACLALAGLGAGMAATGHAGSASPQWLTRPAVFVHVVGATIWVGALVPLLSLALGRSPLLAGALRRFSRIAVGTVAVQVAAGGALMLVQLDAPIAVLNTPYTWILGAKLALVAALLVVAGFNHLSWAPATATGNPAAARRIARSVAAEIVLMAGVLMLVAGWRFTPPPRAIQPPPPPTLLHLEGDGFMAMVRLDPGRVGPNKARINLAKPDGSDFTAQEVSLAFAPADGKLEERTVAAHRTADGTWIADTVFLPTPGLWTLSVMALVDDFDRLEASDATEIRP
jgi:copper transport protein